MYRERNVSELDFGGVAKLAQWFHPSLRGSFVLYS
jgi:hypothetical protein